MDDVEMRGRDASMGPGGSEKPEGSGGKGGGVPGGDDDRGKGVENSLEDA